MKKMFDIESCYYKIDSHDIISFDVFDTLLLRPFFFPTSLFDYLENRYGFTGFSKARKSVKVLDKKEKSIEDIYNNIDGAYKNVINIELQEEQRLIYSNPIMAKVFQYAVQKGKKIIIVSDTYFHEYYVKELLEKNGFRNYQAIYCSCDYQKTKCTGELFEQIILDYNVKANTILHIGDNRVSDYAVPESKGIDTFWIESHAEQYLKYRSYLRGSVENYWDSVICKMCADNYSCMSDYVKDTVKSSWYRFGYDVAGPLCWSFAKWLNDIVDQDENITNIAFVARDGYLVKKMFDCMQHRHHVNSRYVYAPRIVTTLVQDKFENKAIQPLTTREKELLDSVYNLREIDINERENFIEGIIEEYKDYILNEKFEPGIIGVVDSSTNNLSSQKLIDNFSRNGTCGLYYFSSQYTWTLGYKLRTFQKEHYKVIESEDLFEIVFKSPEPAIKGFINGKIEFNDLTENEKSRIENFKYIERGALDFFDDIETKKISGYPGAAIINDYLTRFCVNPIKIERKIIEDGFVSGGIANRDWRKTRLFISSRKVSHRKIILMSVKNKLTQYPKLFIFLRRIYHFIKYR